MDGHRATWTPSSARRNCDICVQKKVTSTRYNAQPNGVSDVMSDKLSSRSCHFMPCFHVKYVSLADVQQLHEYEIPSTVVVVCVCVCVFFPLIILDIKFFRRTSRGHTGGRSHRISHPPSFCGACLNFSREKDSAISIPRRPLSRILCTNDLINRSPLVGHFFSFFLRKKKRLSGFELASQRVRRLRCYF